jgi:hypothetical protein
VYDDNHEQIHTLILTGKEKNIKTLEKLWARAEHLNTLGHVLRVALAISVNAPNSSTKKPRSEDEE